jgi:deoxyribodipyrimidine photolyase-related protein
MKSALILYPHQLYATGELPTVDTVILVEDPLSFGVDQEHRQQLHKQKLIVMRASMRRYAEEVLWPAGLKVEYVELDVFMQTKDLLERARKFDRTFMYDPSNEILTLRLLQARREMGEHAPAIEFLASPNFYLKEQEIRQYFAERHKHPFAEFYQWQRERFNILIDDYKPVGGAWMLEPKAAEPTKQLPSFAAFGDNKWVQEATDYVQKHFSDNPGTTDCIWPTSHTEAVKWLHDFVEHRLDGFAPQNEVFSSQAPWLYHSALASSLNSGLLGPQQVVDAALKRHATRPVALESLELFIRQILGQREFMRGVSLVGGHELRQSNPLKMTRRLTNDWYNGTTGIPVYDDLVKKVLARGYAHHTERLLIAGTLMTLCEITPTDIHKWFSELFVDSQDWALVPHVYSLSQFADNGTLEGGPYICTSKTLMDKSDYQRGEWVNVWDGLYWRFIEKHRSVLSKNPRMRSVVQRLDRLDPDQRRIIHYRAEDFLNKFTQ